MTPSAAASDWRASDASPTTHELVISDTGEQLELDWREPRRAQLAPVADSILQFFDTSLEAQVAPQMGMF